MGSPRRFWSHLNRSLISVMNREQGSCCVQWKKTLHLNDTEIICEQSCIDLCRYLKYWINVLWVFCYGKSNNTLCEWFKGSCVCVSAWVCVHDLSVPLHWNYLIILNRVLSIVLNPCNRNFAFQWFCPNPQSSLHPRSKLGSRPPSAGCKVQNSHFWRFHLK